MENRKRPPQDYYEIFGIETRLDLDASDLQQRYYRLSRELHPDRFSRASLAEREYSLEATAILNDAYRTLREPIARAEYVLKKNGFDIGEQRTKDVPPELLEEVFGMNMALEELRTGDITARPQLEESHRKFLRMLDEIDGQVQRAFAAHDAAPNPESANAVLAQIRGLLNRRRYVRNLVSQAEAELSAFA
ncbi:MAG: Fe-S protein assembly co-chaperone HscB [Bryobacteraceae bacterium]